MSTTTCRLALLATTGAALLLAMLPVDTARAQPAESDSTAKRFWVDFGVGMGTFEEEYATGPHLAMIVSANYQRSSHLLTLRFAGNTGIIFSEDWSDLALLYGRATGQGAWHASAGAGLGIVQSNRENGVAVGLPLQAQFSFHPFGAIGIGVTGFYNLNVKQSFGGATVALQFGSLL